MEKIKELLKNDSSVLVLGLFPSVVVSTTFMNSVYISLAVFAVMLLSVLTVSCLKKVMAEKFRFLFFALIMAFYTTLIKLVLDAFLPDIAFKLGVFVPLAAVNLLIFERCEVALQNRLLPSLLSSVFKGIVFSFILLLVGAIREILGLGTLFGDTSFCIKIGFIPPLRFFSSPASVFIVLGFVFALIKKIFSAKSSEKGDAHEA